MSTLTPGAVDRVFSEPAIDSTGRDALRITIVIQDEALPKISGDAVVDTLVRVQRRLFEAGEERFPIVEYATIRVTESGDS